MSEPEVSRNRPRPRDRQTKRAPAKCRSVNVVVVYCNGDDISASCGWTTSHPREKVREDRIDAHLAKRHNGRGLRLY